MKIKAFWLLFGLLLATSGALYADEGRMLADELANAPTRSDADKERDVQRKPDQVLTFEIAKIKAKQLVKENMTHRSAGLQPIPSNRVTSWVRLPVLK